MLARKALDGRRPPERYPTVVRPVEDVSLIGTADLEPWREMIRRAGVHPFLATPDRVEVQLFGARTKFKGIRFTELSLSVSVCHEPNGEARDGALLATAVNTVRFFAWVERAMFKTPYEHGSVDLAAGMAPSFASSTKAGSVMRATAARDGRERQPGDAHWEGPIYLPPRDARGGGRCFFGRILGASVAFGYDPDVDAFEVEPVGNAALELLAASEFAPMVWQVRTGAEHGRTKSYAMKIPVADRA